MQEIDIVTLQELALEIKEHINPEKGPRLDLLLRKTLKQLLNEDIFNMRHLICRI